MNDKNNPHISNNWLISLRLKIQDKEELKFQRMRILEISHSQQILLRPVWKLLNSLDMYQNSPKGDLSNSINQEYRIINLPSSPQLNIKDDDS